MPPWVFHPSLVYLYTFFESLFSSTTTTIWRTWPYGWMLFYTFSRFWMFSIVEQQLPLWVILIVTLHAAFFALTSLPLFGAPIQDGALYLHYTYMLLPMLFIWRWCEQRMRTLKTQRQTQRRNTFQFLRCSSFKWYKKSVVVYSFIFSLLFWYCFRNPM